MTIPDHLQYTKAHDWVRVEGDIAIVGISAFAQHELGDIVFVEVETEGETLDKEASFGVIEAVKTVSDLFMPISGVVEAFNCKLEDSPDLINSSPYDDGWIIRIKIKDHSELTSLLSAAEYKKLI